MENIGTATSYTALKASWARATAAPFRDSKSKVAEGGIRVPAFAHFSGVRSGVDHSYMRVMDLAPTFLELAGTRMPDATMGRSLVVRWQGGAPAYGDDEPIAFEVYGRRGVHRGAWKLLLQEPPYGTGDWQLYNLATDPGEQTDLSSRHPQIREELKSAWEAYSVEVGVVLPKAPIRY